MKGSETVGGDGLQREPAAASIPPYPPESRTRDVRAEPNRKIPRAPSFASEVLLHTTTGDIGKKPCHCTLILGRC